MTKKAVSDFARLNLGALLVAAGVYFFKFPNHFTTGGVSGISIALGQLVPSVSGGTFVWLINGAMLVVGFAMIGGQFGLKTVYASAAYSAVIWLLERYVPLSAPLTGQPFLELIYSVLLPAAGSAILFDIGASTGGSDITAMILKKYSNLDIGRALLYVDAGIAASAIFVFNLEAGLYSILGLAMKALVVDSLLESLHLYKYFNIVTNQPDLVCDFIANRLKRGATVLRAEGYYERTERTLLLAAMTRPQAIQLNRFLKLHDPQAFVMIMNTSSVIGKGFRNPAD
ncbi:MAG: YitT family protein [Clostridiales bacterium]|nr:YitT family protein [Clostridiales bacterium]